MRRGTRRTAILCCLALALGGGAWWLARDADAPRTADGERVGDAPTAARPPPILAGTGRPTAPAAADPAPLPADDAKPAAPGTLVVTVVGTPGNAPLVGAEVILRGPEGAAARSGVTDAAGVARFDGIEGDAVGVEARAAGRVREVRSVDGLRRPVERTLRLVLKAGAALDGRVSEVDTGRPLPGATVVARVGGAVDGMSVSSSEPALSSVISDGEGRFRIGGIPLREVVTLGVQAAGWRPARRTVMLGEGAAEHPSVEIALRPAARVTGRVVDARGVPVPGAEVLAIETTTEAADVRPDELELETGPWGFAVRADATAVADAEGRFRLDGVPVGSPLRFLARTSQGARSALTDPPVSLVRDREHPVPDLRLRPAGALTLEIVDTHGASLPGGSVHMEVPGREVEAVPVPPSSFRYASLPPGRHEVIVGCAGYVRTTLQVDVGDGQEVVRRVALERGLTIAGTVVDDLGAPVVRAWVKAEVHGVRGDGAGDADWRYVTGALSDADGRFLVGGLPAGAYRLSALESLSASSGHATASAPADDVRLVLPRSGARHVQVVLPAGAPAVEDVGIYVEDLASHRVRGTTRGFGDGRVAMPGLPPRAVRLVIQVEGYAPWIHEEVVAPGSDLDLGEARLDVGGELVGAVLDEAGAAIPGARVRVVMPAHVDDEVATTDGDGTYRALHLPRGSVDVRIAAEGFLSGKESVAIEGGVARATFVLAKGVHVRGTVRSESGRATTGLRVSFRRQGDARPGVAASGEAVVDAAGAFEALVARGTHLVEVQEAASTTVLGRVPAVTVPTGAPLEVRVP